jgi:hypothetical protein
MTTVRSGAVPLAASCSRPLRRTGMDGGMRIALGSDTLASRIGAPPASPAEPGAPPSAAQALLAAPSWTATQTRARAVPESRLLAAPRGMSALM